MMKVKSARADYTGGGIYVFTGELTDGNFFIADCSFSAGFYGLRIVNNNPENLEESLEVDWQEKHLVKDVARCKGFMKDMFKWIIENRPYGNYLVDDMKYILGNL